MSEAQPDDEPDHVGYQRPSKRTRFKKGQSGNPRGRPRNRHQSIPYNSVLGQMVTVREGGLERRVTAAEAFLLQLTQKGLAGDSTAARASLTAVEEARAKRRPDRANEITTIVLIGYGVGVVLKCLGLGIKKNRFDKHKVRWELLPWIVELALNRLGDRHLTMEEQREVWSNTNKPEKVKWPEWWAFLG